MDITTGFGPVIGGSNPSGCIIMANYCYLNGSIKPLDQATISICDIGLLRGFSVFDFLRCYHGKPFLLKWHLERFKNSAQTVGLKIPLKDAEIEKIITTLLEKNKLKEATVKIFLSGGFSDDGLQYNKLKPTFFIIIKPAIQYPKKLFTDGAKLITQEHQREKASAKTSNYLTLMASYQNKQRAGAIEILYTHRGEVLEGATSNFFLIKNGRLITAEKNILLGTRRRLILKLAKNKFPIEIRKISTDELKNCDEAFICSTTRNIVPIVTIDKKKIKRGKVGPITKQLMSLIDEKIKSECA